MTGEDHSDAEPRLEHELVDTLDRLLLLIRQMPTSSSLSPTSAGVLSRLARTGPLRLSDLAALEALSQPAMTQLVTRLEQAGCVTRGPGADDRRVVLVEITTTGRRVIAQRKLERAATLARGLHQLTRGQLDAVAAALPALARLAEVGFEHRDSDRPDGTGRAEAAGG